MILAQKVEGNALDHAHVVDARAGRARSKAPLLEPPQCGLVEHGEAARLDDLDTLDEPVVVDDPSACSGRLPSCVRRTTPRVSTSACAASIRGGDSVCYGPNSVRGIVNFLTEPAADAAMMRIGLRYGSDDDFSESLAIGGTWGRLGALFVGVTTGGDGFRDNYDHRDNELALKVRYAISEDESLQEYSSRLQEKADQPGGSTQASCDRTTLAERRRDHVRLGANASPVTPPLKTNSEPRFAVCP